MDFWTAIVLLALISGIASVMRAKHGVVKTRGGEMMVRDHAALAENERLRDELRALKDRVATLERIATDGNGSSLDREIERLRDRP